MRPVPVEVMERADKALAAALREYSLEELRYDWCCNISPRSRAILKAELDRRRVTYEQFSQLGRGRRRP